MIIEYSSFKSSGPCLVQMFVLQACDITGGLYLKIPQKVALAQYLLVRVQCIFPPCHASHLPVGRASVLTMVFL